MSELIDEQHALFGTRNSRGVWCAFRKHTVHTYKGRHVVPVSQPAKEEDSERLREGE